MSLVLRRDPRLVLFDDENFRGRRAVFRGNLGIRNLERVADDPESLRFSSNRRGATLVLFSERNFRGAVRVFRGNVSIRDLDNIRLDDVESLVMSNRRLSLETIRRIRRTGRLPSGFRVI